MIFDTTKNKQSSKSTSRSAQCVERRTEEKKGWSERVGFALFVRKIFGVRRNSLDNGGQEEARKRNREAGRERWTEDRCNRVYGTDRTDQKLVSPGLASRIINVGTRIAPWEHPLLPPLFGSLFLPPGITRFKVFPRTGTRRV